MDKEYLIFLIFLFIPNYILLLFVFNSVAIKINTINVIKIITLIALGPIFLLFVTGYLLGHLLMGYVEKF